MRNEVFVSIRICFVIFLLLNLHHSINVHYDQFDCCRHAERGAMDIGYDVRLSIADFAHARNADATAQLSNGDMFMAISADDKNVHLKIHTNGDHARFEKCFEFQVSAISSRRNQLVQMWSVLDGGGERMRLTRWLHTFTHDDYYHFPKAIARADVRCKTDGTADFLIEMRVKQPTAAPVIDLEELEDPAAPPIASVRTLLDEKALTDFKIIVCFLTVLHLAI